MLNDTTPAQAQPEANEPIILGVPLTDDESVWSDEPVIMGIPMEQDTAA